MTTGQIVGGIVGAAIGFYFGGPQGAMMGASLGMMIGGMIDPMEADTPSIGQPEIQANTAISVAEEGQLVTEILGVGKTAGNIFFYGGERNEPIIAVQSYGGKGMGGQAVPDDQAYVKEIIYYLTWAVGICMGPVDALLAIYRNNDLVWEGILEPNSDGLCQSTTIEGLGTMTFYFGTDTQIADPYIQYHLSNQSLSPGYRGFCYAVFHDCLLGRANRCPTMKFVVRRRPSCDFDNADLYKEIEYSAEGDSSGIGSSAGEITFLSHDYNPAHALYYILNTLSGLSPVWLSDADYLEIAEALFEEQLGICMVLNTESQLLEYINYILNHIRGGVNFDNGKFVPYLVRDYDPDSSAHELPEFDEDDLLDDPTIFRENLQSLQGETRVEYSELSTLSNEDPITALVDYPLLPGEEEPVCDCIGSEEIGYTEQHMAASSEQLLSVVSPSGAEDNEVCFTWELTPGMGFKFKGDSWYSIDEALSVTLIAPANNPDCMYSGAAVELYCDGNLVDTVAFSTSTVFVDENTMAYHIRPECQSADDYFGGGSWCALPGLDYGCVKILYNCYAEIKCVPTSTCPHAVCCEDEGCTGYCSPGYDGSCGITVDMRTSWMIEHGCCPAAVE